MKRFLIVTAVMVLTVGAVYGFSTNVPFYADTGGTSGSGTGVGQQSAYIGIHNNSSASVVITLKYFSADGVDLGPPTDNTATIIGNSSVSFRPAADYSEGATPGGGSETDYAATIPDRPTTDGSAPNGSIVISWVTGDENTIQGREHQQNNAFAAAYLLPPGK